MGGGQAFALKLARFVSEERPDHRVRLLCPGPSELAERAVDAGVEVSPVELPDVSPLGAMRGAAIARGLLRSAGPDVVVVGNHPRAHAYLAAGARFARRHPPLVFVAHDQETASRRSARRIYGRAGALVCVGANAAATYEQALPGVAVHRINNFLLDVPATSPPRGDARGEPRLGVLGRMIPEKGVLELIEELVAHRDAWSLLRVAAAPEDPDYVTAVEARLAELRLGSRVERLGHVADVPGFLAAIDVLVVPSVGMEVQPTVILEALAHGRPVVVRQPLWSPDFDGLPVVPYDDADGLARALAQAVTLPVPPWSEVQQRFGPAQALEGIEAAAQASSARS